MEFTVEQGWLSGARRVPSPNFGPRPAGCTIDLLVVHSISLPPGQYGGDCIEHFFCNQLDWDAHPYFAEIRDLQVSAHLLIRRSGEVVQFVSFEDRAWHAGRSCFRGRHECNDFSIGIELEGMEEDAYTAQQYQQLASVSSAVMTAYPLISADRITGHSDIAPGRKTDPGPAFDWAHYRAALSRRGYQA